ncbi:MAG: 2-oxoacid:ferredoxin oxidoreductase subunit beta [Dehalococcoidia bacterium]|jgi:2-oxoglutarate ferredoxin oxidoreductase subunit beta|nr:2-oxoacid:ferredoxin oxidoreductase subunit beta [Dehalococcoidia bacterium]
MDDLATYAQNTWCTGCGNFGILGAFKKAVRRLESEGTPRRDLAIVTGIGCHGKIFDYLNLNGFYSLHGRSVATAQGIKLGNPALKVVAFVGDGDAYGEGIAHLVFAAKRNADITVIVHNNGTYGLTTGQATPTSRRGFRGPSTPRGTVEDPLNPLALMLTAGATFVARGYPMKLDHLVELMVRAVRHEGFSLLDVLQPCVTFNNTYELYNSMVTELDSLPGALEDSLGAARRTDRLLIGVMREVPAESHHRLLMGDSRPAEHRATRARRLKAVRRFVS